MKIQDCYRILNIQPGADWKEVKQSFHALAKKYHPDSNDGDPSGAEKFKEISRAYGLLQSWYLKGGFAYRVNTPVSTASKIVVPSHSEIQKNKPGILKRLNRWNFRFWTWLERLEGRWLKRDVEKPVTIDWATADQGGTIKIKNSAGYFFVQIPAGTEDGTLIRIPGKGEAGLLNRKPGDLVVKVRVATKNVKLRKPREYFYQVRVYPNQSNSTPVRTLMTHEGPLQYRLPENLKNGQSFIFQSRPHPQTGETSRHILVIDLL